MYVQSAVIGSNLNSDGLAIPRAMTSDEVASPVIFDSGTSLAELLQFRGYNFVIGSRLSNLRSSLALAAFSASFGAEGAGWHQSTEGNMFSLLWALIIGLIVGALAKLLMPGKDPGGIWITMALG